MEEIDWTNVKKNKWSTSAPPHDWPSEVIPISLGGLTLFGINQVDGRLFWDGKEIIVRSTMIKLRGIELSLLFLAALGSLMQGIATFEPWFKKLTGWW